MTLSDFEDGLDRYGGALHRWPPAERAEAARMIASDARARALMADMEEIEAAWHTSGRPHEIPSLPNSSLAARAVANRQIGSLRRRDAFRRSGTTIGWTSAAAAALIVGVVLGDWQAAASRSALQQGIAAQFAGSSLDVAEIGDGD